jgi:hypothetical protein
VEIERVEGILSRNKSRGRPRMYETAAERQAAFRARRKQELAHLLAQQRPDRHPRHDLDVYLTPEAFIRAALRLVTITPVSVLDVAAGDGRWGQAARTLWPQAVVAGVEIRDLPKPADFDAWFAPADFLLLAAELPKFDAVITNPPYRHAEAVIRAGLSLLRPGGELVAFLRLAFREGRQRNQGLFKEHPVTELAVCAARPKFYGFRSGQTAMAVFRWRQGYTGPCVCSTLFTDAEEATP